MTQRSLYNNTTVALGPFGVFTGRWEPTSIFLEISAYVNSTAYLAIGIQQSQDASAVSINTTYNYSPTDEVTVFNTAVGLPFYRLVVSNEGNFQVGHMSATTILNALPSNVSATITGDVTVSGNVVSTPALLPAQLRHTPLVVGHWYQVASAGDTPGAVWAEMGAIVGGESVPPVGRQFQCLYAGYGTGTAYDITAPVDATGVASVTVVGNVDVTCQNLPIVNNGHDCVAVSVDSWNVASIPVLLDTAGNTMKIDPANNGVSFNDASTVTVSSITNPLPVGTNILGFVGLDATNGNNTVAISQSGTANGVQIVSALPAGTQVIGKVGLDTGGNTIGVVGIDTSLNTIKIDPTSNEVKINPTAQAPVRRTGLSNTAVSVGGPGLLYGASYQNKSATVNCWIKLYDSPTVPSATDTPFLIQYLEAVQLYTLNHSNDSFFNTPVADTLWVRATLLPDDADTTDTGVDCEVTFFVGA